MRTIGELIKNILENQPRIQFTNLAKLNDDDIYVLKYHSNSIVFNDITVDKNKLISSIDTAIEELKRFKEEVSKL